MEEASAPHRASSIESRAERLAEAMLKLNDHERPEGARSVIELVDSVSDPSDSLRAYAACARAFAADDPETAFELLCESRELFVQANNPVGTANLLAELARHKCILGQFDEAEGYFQEALALHREHRMAKEEAGTLGNLGILYAAQGDSERGIECLLEARRLYARIGHTRGEGMVLVNTGPVYQILGAFPDALGALVEGIDLLEGHGLETYVVTGLATLATIYGAAGVPEEAIRCAEQALERAPAESAAVVESWNALAYALREAGRFEEALDAAETGLAHARRLGQDSYVADALLIQGDTQRDAGQLAEAEAPYREGLALAEEMDYLPTLLGLKLGLAILLERRGDAEGALALAAPLVEPWERYGERHTLIKLQELLSRLAEASDDPGGALKHLKRAQTIRVDLFRRETDVRVRGIQVAQELKREREQSSQVLRDLSHRVMESQEEERRRVATDLHDGLGQRLALLAVESDMLAQAPPCEPEELSSSLRTLADHAQSAADQVHVISHHLHPAPLAQLGLVAATRGLCEDVAKIQAIEIEFVAEDVPRRVPDDIALCLYRIVQEGLNNATRHGNASRASVLFAATNREIRLELADEGAGFDPDRLETPGLGLAGMRERASHLDGRFELHSRPGNGTRIEIVIPLPAESA